MNFPETSGPTELPGSRVKVAFGVGALNHIGPIIKAEGASRVLLVSDPGISAAGHVERAVRALYQAGLTVRVYDEAGENPTTAHVTKGLAIGRPFKPDLIVGLGGGMQWTAERALTFC